MERKCTSKRVATTKAGGVTQCKEPLMSAVCWRGSNGVQTLDVTSPGQKRLLARLENLANKAGSAASIVTGSHGVWVAGFVRNRGRLLGIGVELFPVAARR